VEGIQDQFREWVDGIDISGAKRRFKFDPSSRFITFNYTSTLQEIYGIEDSKVLHIHGRARKTELVFGHGVDIAEEDEFDPETGESNRTMFSDAEGSAKYPLYAFKKQVEEIIDTNRSHFVTLNDISEIVIIGHSLNDVDLPYFLQIANYATSCKWTVYCYQELDWEHHPLQLVHCGISRDRIITRSY
jgi:Bacteriophage abortive infection AbiH